MTRTPRPPTKSLHTLNGIERADFTALEQLPNIGPALATDLRRIGIARPSELIGQDPYQLYDQLCRTTGQRHDPCVLDTFLAAVRFMDGGPAQPWWAFTAERKRVVAARAKNTP